MNELTAQLPVRTLASVPDGMQPVVLTRLVADRLKAAPDDPVSLVFVARDGRRMQRLAEVLAQMLPGHEVLTLPAWDSLPYDRVSPNGVTISARMQALSTILRPDTRGAVVVTAVNAVIQKLVPRDIVRGMSFSAAAGQVVDSDRLVAWAADNGYLRVPTVRESGEYAVRGGLVDLYPAAYDAPLRFDFFGRQLESIRTFDADSQRTTGTLKRVELVPMSELVLNEDTIRRFRQNYTRSFGGNTADDPLYGAISAGSRYSGAEHWLPFFYEHLESLSDYTGDAPFVFDDQSVEAYADRVTQVRDYYEAREQARQQPATSGVPYKPVPPDSLYLVDAHPYALAGAGVIQLSPFTTPNTRPEDDIGGRIAPSFAAERSSADTNLFEAVVQRLLAERRAGRRAVVACWSQGTRERMTQVLKDHGLTNPRLAENWNDAVTTSAATTSIVVLGLETGFETDDLIVLSEQDILGERILKPQRKRKASDALTEAASLAAGDLVVHVDHGIGRFIGLKVIEAGGAPHECVEIEYAGDTKLYLPVENIELLSRYGSEDTGIQLDKLGGVAWQAKKGRLKKRIREMAEQLIKIAAARQLSRVEAIDLQPGAYEEFAARFPFEETEDQLTAIEAVFDDITAGRVMDRLVCGDVGFGKTEVALRAAFAVAHGRPSGGRGRADDAARAPALQDLRRTFCRPAGRVAPCLAAGARPANSRRPRQGLADGQVDIVVGTHALLSKSIEFKDLGLLIIDEEQHFGVGHKERLKELKSNVHVLTLTATPIPRTLQLALTGVRDLSLLATPPVDRLAIRTFISPFDPLMVREALLREKYRGGQSFYVVPRIKDQPRHRRVPAHPGARGLVHRRQRTDARRRARRHHECLLRRQVRRAGRHHHRRIRARHPQCQHADRASRRQFRPRAALPDPRPHRALQAARLCAVHRAARPQAHRYGRAPPRRAAIARKPRRRLPARQSRSRHPRRRQPARRGAVRPYPRGRLRALSGDAGRGRGRPQDGRGGLCRRQRVEPVDLARHAGDDPRALRARPHPAHAALSPARRPQGCGRDRRRRCGIDRPLRPLAGRS
jgi:transcription-repair coupling factor (superfamily II helicase)